MANGSLNISVKGLREIVDKFKDAPRVLKEEVTAELHAAGFEIEGIAKRLAPKDNAGGGGIAGRFFVESKELHVRVGNSSNYAAYQEFGTGVHAASYVTTLPKDWQDYAKKFFKTGKGRIPAHPFMFPAYEQVRPKLIKRLKTLLDEK